MSLYIVLCHNCSETAPRIGWSHKVGAYLISQTNCFPGWQLHIAFPWWCRRGYLVSTFLPTYGIVFLIFPVWRLWDSYCFVLIWISLIISEFNYLCISLWAIYLKFFFPFCELPNFCGLLLNIWVYCPSHVDLHGYLVYSVGIHSPFRHYECFLVCHPSVVFFCGALCWTEIFTFNAELGNVLLYGVWLVLRTPSLSLNHQDVLLHFLP